MNIIIARMNRFDYNDDVYKIYYDDAKQNIDLEVRITC